MAEAAIPKAALFDIDATLITSGGAGAVAWDRAFQELYSVPADIGEFTRGGMTDPEVGRLTFEGVMKRPPASEELAQLMAKRLEHLTDTIAESEGYAVLPGVEELLDRLIDAGLLLGLSTGNVESSAHIKLARGNLNRFFSFGGYGSDSTDRVELTKKGVERAGVVSGGTVGRADCVSAGDTPLDIAAAHGAGIRIVGVATGAHPVEELKEAGADWTVSSFADGFPPVDEPGA